MKRTLSFAISQFILGSKFSIRTDSCSDQITDSVEIQNMSDLSLKRCLMPLLFCLMALGSSDAFAGFYFERSSSSDYRYEFSRSYAHTHWSGYGFAYKKSVVSHHHGHYCSHHSDRYNYPPHAKPGFYKTYQNQSTPVRLKATDPNGDHLLFKVISLPKNGSLSGEPPYLTYTPKPGFVGKDFFRFKASDGRRSSYSWVKIWVKPDPNAYNRAPEAKPGKYTIEQDTPSEIRLVAEDKDGDELEYSIVSYPENGLISGAAPNLIYTPNSGYQGLDVFSFKVNDGKLDSETVDIEIDIVATSCESEPTHINVDAFNHHSVSKIQLNGIASHLTPNYRHSLKLTNSLRQSGSAFFKEPVPLTGDNGFLASFSASFSFKMSHPIGISDSDGQGADGLVFVLQTVSSFVGSNGGGIGYQGIPNSLGIEFDTWNNGSSDRNNGNHIGINLNGSVNSVAILPISSRMNNGQTHYAWVDYNGQDKTLEVRMSLESSRPAQAQLVTTELNLPAVLGSEMAFVGFSSGTGDAGGKHEVLGLQFQNSYRPIGQCNQPPNASDLSLSIDEDQEVEITLIATDSDNDALEYTIVSEPQQGSVSDIVDGVVRYTPNANYSGVDSFTYSVSDGAFESEPATVSITINPVNDAPEAANQTVSVVEDISNAVVLSGSDVDSDTLTYSIVSAPVNGVLTGDAPNLVYVPNRGFNGSDAFTFTISDSELVSEPATVSIIVTPVNDAPMANNQTVTVDEDAPVQITLVASDADNDTLIYSVLGQPLNGFLTGDAPNLVYTPNTDFNGADSFTFKVNDGELDSSFATLSIIVNPVNDAPLTNDQSIVTDEDGSTDITLSGTDLESESLSYVIQAQPENGTLTGTAANLTYTPNPNFFGSDEFTFSANDGELESSFSTVSITINSVNDAPNANDQASTLDEDTSVLITLSANDIDDDNLTYSIVSNPAKGVLSGELPNLEYQPNDGFNGSDSFTFNVSDGQLVSELATVSIMVNPINDAPTADNQSVVVDEDSSLELVLNGNDIDGDLVSYTIETLPINGLISGDAPNLSYTPNSDFNGDDSFTFTVNDGELDSAPATISITVNSVNDAPTADNQSVSLDEDSSLNIVLTANDIESSALTYSVISLATNGTLSGEAPGVIYTPNANFNGEDSFTFKVNDGQLDSSLATVSISVNPVNDVPIANDQSLSLNEDSSLDIVLNVSDVEESTLTYDIVSLAANGSISGDAPNLVYTPNADFTGTDSFAFTVNDGELVSEIATVSLTINALNDAPTAEDLAVTLDEDSSESFVLASNDIDGDTLSYLLESLPTNGVISGDAPNLVYTPNADFNGVDSLTFKVNDSELDSALATVSITVNPINDAPIADDQSITLDEDSSINLTLIANDVEGQVLTYSVMVAPSNGTLTGDAPDLVYTPNANFNGRDQLTFIANDGELNSETITILIDVQSVNDAPVADNQTRQLNEGSSLDITLTGNDIDLDLLTYSIVISPSNGVLSGTAPNLVYTPSSTFNGTDSFTFSANDGELTSEVAMVSLTVNAVNDSPIADDQVVSLDEDSSAAIVLTANDVDADTLSYSIESLPSNGVVSGDVPNLVYTPNPDFNGNDSLSFSVSDGQLSSNVATVSLQVTPVNDPPVANGLSLRTELNTAVNVPLSASDKDLDALSYTVTTEPQNGSLSGIAPDLILTPNTDFFGEISFEYTVSDGDLTDTAQVIVQVLQENRVPSITSTPFTIANVGVDYFYQVKAADLDNDPLSYSLVDGPTGIIIDPSSGDLQWTPDTKGLFSVEIKVDDGRGGVDTQKFDIEVLGKLPPITSEGLDFWFMFNLNAGDPGSLSKFQFFITSRFDSSVTIEIPLQGISREFSIAAGSVETVDLSDLRSLLSTSTQGIEDNGIHVFSDRPVSVYALNFYPKSTDATLLIPTSALGKEYNVASYGQALSSRGSYFGVVALEDDTQVTYTLSEDITNLLLTAGEEYTISLNRGQTYQLNGSKSSDLSGSNIRSNKNVAVTAGSNCTAIQAEFACDHLVEQIVPIKSLGAIYYTTPLALKTKGDTFRLFGIEDNTLIKINGRYETIVNKGEYYEKIISEPSVIEADSPLQVMQYSNSIGFGGFGDPFMLIVPSAEYYVNSYVVTTPAEGYSTHFVNIISPASNIDSVKVDGVNIAPEVWQPIVGTDFVGTQVAVDTGPHTVTSSNEPIGVYAYGYETADSYGYLGGLSFSGSKEVSSLDVALSPTQAEIGQEQCIDVTAYDQNGDVIPQQQVQFTFTGLTSSFSRRALELSDLDGKAQHCINKGFAETQQVTVSAQSITETLNIGWLPYAGNENSPPVIESLPILLAPLRELYSDQVLAYDPNGDELTYSLSEAPEGMSVGPTTGLISWQVPNDFLASPVTINVTDSQGASVEQAYLLSFDPSGNHFPTLIVGDATPADAIAERVNSFPLQAEDLDNDSITLSVEDGPEGLTISSSNILWNPTLDQLGDHSVLVRVTDSKGGFTVGEFNINVRLNALPIFTSVPPTQTIAGREEFYTMQVTDSDGDSTVYELVSAPEELNASISGRRLLWNANPDLIGSTVTVIVRVDDRFGGQAEQTVSMLVTGNRAPQFTSTPNFSVFPGVSYSYNVTTEDPDGDRVSLSLESGAPGMTFSGSRLFWNVPTDQLGDQEVVIIADDRKGAIVRQSFILSPSNRAPFFGKQPEVTAIESHEYVYDTQVGDPDRQPVTLEAIELPLGARLDGEDLVWIPGPEQIGPHNVVLKAIDSAGAFAQLTYTLVVVENRAPEFTSRPKSTGVTEHPYLSLIQAFDPDGDMVQLSLVSGPDGMTINGRLLNWTPTATQIGEFDLTLKISDGLGKSAESSFVVSITENQAPQITREPEPGTSNTANYISYFTATDPDRDRVTYRIVSGPEGLKIGSSGLISWFQEDIVMGIHTVEMEASDPYGATIIYEYELYVISDQLTFIDSPEDTTIFDGEPYRFDVFAVHPNNQEVRYVLTQNSANAYINSRSGQIEWTPTVDQLGVNVFEVAAQTSDGQDIRSSFEITVEPNTNQAPIITSEPRLAGVINVEYLYQVVAQDPEGHELSYSLKNNLQNSSAIDAQSGLIRFTTNSASDYFMVVTVTDERGKTATQEFVLTIAPENARPRINSTPKGFGRVGFTYNYEVLATDANDDPLTYQLTSAPDGMTISSDGFITWAPTNTGVYSVELDVSDGNLVTLQRYQINILPAEPSLDAEIILTPQIVDPGEAIDIAVSVFNQAGGVEGRNLSDPSLNVFFNQQRLTGTVSSDVAGVHTVEITVFDDVETITISKTFRVRDDDATSPVVALFGVEADQRITAPVDVLASVQDDNLESWKLYVRALNSDANEMRLLASGRTNIEQQKVGVLDPSLLRNGQFGLVMIARDLNGNETQEGLVVFIEEELKVGNFSITYEDLNIPLAGIPISIRRTYDSRDRDQDRDFGFGWSLDYQNVKLEESRVPGLGWEFVRVPSGPLGIVELFCLEPKGAPLITVTLPNGDVERFHAESGNEPNCTLFPLRNTFIEFAAVGDTQSTLRVLNPIELFFIDDNLVIDPGEQVVVDPDLYELTTREGYVYVIDQHLGLQTVTDPNGNTLTYTDEGIIHSDGKSVNFVRNSQGRVVKITAPNGTALNYNYDESDNLQSVIDRDGAQTSYTYNEEHSLLDIIDPLGRNVVKNIYNDEGRLIAQQDSEGFRTEFTHDLVGRESVVTDRNGHITVMSYDDKGYVTSQVDALNNQTLYTHDEVGNELSQTNALGHTTQATYNERNDQLTQTDALGNVTRFEYNKFGKETKITDARGNEFTNKYDGVANLVSITDPLDNIAGNDLNRQGLPTRTVDVLGHETFPKYNVDGYKISEIDAEDNLMTFVNDDMGNVLSETSRRMVNGTQVEETTSYKYDARDRLVKTTDALGNETSTEYNEVGNQVAQIDALGRRTEMEYDVYRRLLKTTYPDGTIQENTYDPEGNLLTETDRLGRITTHVYDALNRLVKSTQADGSITLTEYDVIGRVAASVDANGNRSTNQYDAADRRISTTDALGNVTLFAYDADSNLVQMTDANGNVTSYIYNELDQKVQTTFQNSSTMLEGLDALSRKTSMTDQAGVITNYEYDKLGRLTKVIDALLQETTYTYDSVGNKLTQTDAEGRTTSWAYDALGRVISRTLPLGQVESMSYDAIGNVSQSTDFNGQVTTYTYDVNNRMSSISYEGGLEESFVYDAIGNRIQATKLENGATSTWQYTYDNLNRLKTDTQFVGTADEVTLSYEYDAQGNRVMLTEATATQTRITRYTFDALNRLSSVQDPDGNTTTYRYDAVGNRIGMEHENGIQTTYVYDELNRLTSLNHKDSANVTLRDFSYTLLANGKRAKIIEANGRVTDYTYDNLYRLTQESIFDPVNASHSASYTYDKVGNRLFEVVNGVSTSYTVDSNDRLVQTGGTLYTHDAQGNTLTETLDGDVTSYIYNAKQELTASVKDGTTTAYIYNSDRMRIGQGNATSQTLYTLDTNRAYAQVVQEITDGKLAVSYTYGDDLVSQKRAAIINTYHYDGLGSTRALSDDAGGLTDSYDYEAFGEVLSQTGNTENKYLFTGEQFDSNLDQYYLRARYYDQGVGRFTQMDTWMGVDSDPITLNKYLYANVDPANMVDPTGHFAGGFGGFGGAGNIQAILNAAAITSGAYALQSLATSFVESGNAGSLIGTSLERLLNRKTLGPSLATARARAQIRVNSRAKGRGVLFHYTTRASAFAISLCGCILSTNFRGVTVDGFTRPRGAYATSIAPWNVSSTQSSISQRFFGGSNSRVGKLGWFVAVESSGFFPPFGAPPGEFVKPPRSLNDFTVSVKVVTIGPNPMTLY